MKDKKEFSGFPFVLSLLFFTIIVFTLEYSPLFGGASNALNEYFDNCWCRVYVYTIICFHSCFRRWLLHSRFFNFLTERAKRNIYHGWTFLSYDFEQGKIECVNFIVNFYCNNTKELKDETNEIRRCTMRLWWLYEI